MLGARSVAYNEADVTFRGPFPRGITPSAVEVVISYDQALSVTLSRNTFEVRLVATMMMKNQTSQTLTTLFLSFFLFCFVFSRSVVPRCCSHAKQLPVGSKFPSSSGMTPRLCYTQWCAHPPRKWLVSATRGGTGPATSRPVQFIVPAALCRRLRLLASAMKLTESRGKKT